MIPGTTINSYTPTVSAAYSNVVPTSVLPSFGVAWEERGYYSSIKYAETQYEPEEILLNEADENYLMYPGNPQTVSDWSFYQKHYKPSISLVGSPANGGTKMELSWVGERTYYENGVQKVGRNALYRRNTFSTSTNIWSWGGTTWSMGSSNVNCVNVNTMNTDGVVGWNEGGLMNRYIRTSNPYSTRTFNTGPDLTGISLQVNNSTDFNSMYALVFRNNTVPYSFAKSNSVAVIGKTGPDATSSRIAIARLDSAAFYISSRLSLDGKSMGYFTKPDSIKSYDVKTIEEALSTSAFTPQSNSTISYTIEYGALDTLYSMKALSKGGVIQCRLELQDERNGSTLKVLEKFSLDKLTMQGKDGSLRSISGIMDVRKFAGRQLSIKLVIEDGINARWGLMERVLSPEEEPKTEKITSEKAVNYGLSQNYPNPFNPSTVINYQIPKASKVTLKVYDMLGKEVTTLVNGYKEMGSYSVEFNASSLPSGTYIYEIRANDFVKSGKMMLLK